MEALEIETHLAELGQELQNAGIEYPIRILLVGGAFMLTQLHNRATTNDIDIVLKDIDDSTASQLYQIFRSAVRTIATRNKIPASWLNDVIGDFLRDIGTIPEGTLWRRYAMLEVYLPPSEYILALKLLSGRPKDKDDIYVLCQQEKIQDRQQAQKLVDRYIPDKQVQQMNHLDDILNAFFS
ncbi:MAG TPA: hypothetical protein VNE61_12920 [Ktedonobacteraceae bacterium]|nr:hypothetical protein [Ktedonobacteraceae bacterium]